MSIEKPTALERSVLRAMREGRSWRKADLLVESENEGDALGLQQNKALAVNDAYAVASEQALPQDEPPLVLEAQFLSQALLSVSKEMRKAETWSDKAEKKEQSSDALKERILKPNRDEYHDGYKEIEGIFKLTGFRITGDLDLEGGEILFPIAFQACTFEGDLLFGALHCRGIYFWAGQDGTNINYAKYLNLNNAHINGAISLSGLSGLPPAVSKKNKPDERKPLIEGTRHPIEIFAPNLSVSDTLNLYQIWSNKQICLYNLNTGGNLILNDIVAIPDKDEKEDISIALTGAQINGSLLCRNAIIHRALSLVQAEIKGRAEFAGTQFNQLRKSPAQDTIKSESLNEPEAPLIAINAWEATFHSSLFLNRGFKAKGVIDLTSADIKGDLRLRNAEITSFDAATIAAANIKVAGNILISGIFEGYSSALNFAQAKIGGSFFCEDSTIKFCRDKKQKFSAIVLSRADIKGAVFIRNNPLIEGRLRFIQSTIGGVFSCTDTTINHEYGTSIDLDSSTIKDDVYLRTVAAYGCFTLDSTVIIGSFHCQDCKLERMSNPTHESGDWQYAAINLKAAEIERELVIQDMRDVVGLIDLRQANAGIIVNDRSNWQREKSEFRLDGFTYKSIGDYTYSPTPIANDLADTEENIKHDASQKDAPQQDTPKQNKPAVKTKPKAITNSQQLLNWLQKQPSEDIKGEHFKPQPFTQLAKVLAQMGHVNDAKRVLYERDKRITKNEQSLFNPCKPGSFFSPTISSFPMNFASYIAGIIIRATSGYGHLPARAAVWAFFIWFLGGIIFDTAARNELMRPGQEETIVALADPDSDQPIDRVLPIRVNGFIYAADVFLPIVDLSQQHYWIPKDRYELEEERKSHPSLNQDEYQYAPWLSFCADHLPPGLKTVFRPAIESFQRKLQNGFAKFYYWLSILTGWLLTTILVAAFSGVLSKDK